MKAVIVIVILLAVFGVTRQIMHSYDDAKREERATDRGYEPAPAGPTVLSGMPASLESTFEAANAAGVESLKGFLKQYRYAIRDPRLAEIELDYVIQISLKSPSEARQVFRSVQQRVAPGSPLHERVRKMADTYQ
jgi:hypothetical protein